MLWVVAAHAVSLPEFLDACGIPEGLVEPTARGERVLLTLDRPLDAVRDVAPTREDLGALVAPVPVGLEAGRAEVVALCMGSLTPLGLEGWLRWDGAGSGAHARFLDGSFRYPDLGVTLTYARTGRRTVALGVHGDEVPQGCP